MSKRTKRISSWLTGAVVAAALGFGLLVATAKPASALTCADDGWTWLGQQPDAQTCDNLCKSIHGDPEAVGHWNPTTGCCVCLF